MASAKGIRAGRAFVELFADDSKLVRGLRRAEKTELPKARLIGWLGVGRGKFYDRAGPYGQVKEHNAPVPRDHWLTEAEQEAIVARDFKAFIRLCGMTHVRTSPYYPQSNGKLERYHKTLKADCIRPGVPLDLAQARRLIGRFVEHYNTRRLRSAIGYITPADKLAGRSEGIWSSRERKLCAARLARQQARANNRLGELEVSLHPR